jgi:hypothetical protein
MQAYQFNQKQKSKSWIFIAFAFVNMQKYRNFTFVNKVLFYAQRKTF